jgi:hypothetical protein
VQHFLIAWPHETLATAGRPTGQPFYSSPADPPTLKTPKQTKYDPQVYEVTNNGIKMSVTYLDPTECAAQVEKDTQLNRWSAAQVAEEKGKIPEGGYLKASWARDTPLLASADNFVFLVEAPDGREIKRWKSEPTLAQPFGPLGATLYRDITLVPLPERLPDGAKVFVIEASAKRRFDYLIHP